MADINKQYKEFMANGSSAEETFKTIAGTAKQKLVASWLKSNCKKLSDLIKEAQKWVSVVIIFRSTRLLPWHVLMRLQF